MTPADTFSDLHGLLKDLAAAFDGLDLSDLADGDREEARGAWLAATEVCRAADDLCARIGHVMTDTILRA